MRGRWPRRSDPSGRCLYRRSAGAWRDWPVADGETRRRQETPCTGIRICPRSKVETPKAQAQRSAGHRTRHNASTSSFAAGKIVGAIPAVQAAHRSTMNPVIASSASGCRLRTVENGPGAKAPCAPIATHWSATIATPTGSSQLRRAGAHRRRDAMAARPSSRHPPVHPRRRMAQGAARTEVLPAVMRGSFIAPCSCRTKSSSPVWSLVVGNRFDRRNTVGTTARAPTSCITSAMR